MENTLIIVYSPLLPIRKLNLSGNDGLKMQHNTSITNMEETYLNYLPEVYLTTPSAPEDLQGIILLFVWRD
jgi:hypothetical protein